MSIANLLIITEDAVHRGHIPMRNYSVHESAALHHGTGNEWSTPQKALDHQPLKSVGALQLHMSLHIDR